MTERLLFDCMRILGLIAALVGCNGYSFFVRLPETAESVIETESPSIKIGHGYDIHRLEYGRKFILSGLDLKSDIGTVAHSDGDAVFHSVADALLGAIGETDIGDHFPDTDPRWKGVSSDVIVNEALQICHRKGYQVTSVDVTIVLEKPKLRPHIATMRANLARALGVSLDVVNLKARTHEGLDSTGRGEAVETHAVVLIQKVAGGKRSRHTQGVLTAREGRM